MECVVKGAASQGPGTRILWKHSWQQVGVHRAGISPQGQALQLLRVG